MATNVCLISNNLCGSKDDKSLLKTNVKILIFHFHIHDKHFYLGYHHLMVLGLKCEIKIKLNPIKKQSYITALFV